MERDLRTLIEHLIACPRPERISLREPILAFGEAAIEPLLEAVGRNPDLGASVCAWLGVLATRVVSTRPRAIVALLSLSGRGDGTAGYASDVLKRLGSQTGRARISSPSANSKQVAMVTGASLAGAYSVLEQLVTEWRASGKPPQKGIEWPRAEWIAAFPGQADLLRRLPRLLDRASVREVCILATQGLASTEQAFLAAMVWGYGSVGYGRHRVREILEGTPRPVERLLTIAQTLKSRGAVAAYHRLADGNDCRLRGLGPAFGTKYLYYCQPDGTQPMALIHDSNIAVWFWRNAGVELPCDAWSRSAYATYLAQMHEWADRLQCRPDDLELLMFQTTVRGQWAE